MITAGDQIGIDRNRSRVPLVRSVFRLRPELTVISSTAITSVPGSRNRRYSCGEPDSAPPNR
jgi:hypothetical protein